MPKDVEKNIDKSMKWIDKYGSGQCTFDSNRVISHFVMYILSPILLIRIYSHFKYRNALPGEFL